MHKRSFKHLLAGILAFFLISLVVGCTLLGEPEATPIPTPRPPTRIPDPTPTGPPVYSWERFDVAITVLGNGDLRVVERQQLHFSGRPFTYGYRLIPADSAGRKYTVTDVSVRQANVVYTLSAGQEANTFLVEESENETVIGWFFPESIGTQIYEFQFTVQNAVETDSQGDLVLWPAMPANLGARIDTGAVTITVPPGVEIQSTIAQVDGREEEGFIRAEMSADKQQATFTLEQPRPAEVEVGVGVRLPAGVIQHEPPNLYRVLVDPVLESPPAEKGYRPGAVEHYSHGIDYFLAGRMEPAIDEFTWAILLQRTFAEAYYFRGLAHYLVGDQENADVDLRQAIEFDPQFEAHREHVFTEVLANSDDPDE